MLLRSHILSPPQIHTMFISVSLLTVTIIFSLPEKRVSHRFGGTAAHRGGTIIMAYNGNSLLKHHQPEGGEGESF